MNAVMEFRDPILIVDDEPDLVDVLAKLFRSMGLEVIATTSPEEAVQLFHVHRPFLVVSDFKMPKMTGLEVCEAMRRHAGRSFFFLLLTAYADKSTALEGIKIGVDEILEKPFQVDNLKTRIRAFIDRRQEEISKEKAELDEITGLFVEEARDLLGDLDALILRLEEKPIDGTVIDLLFRKVHSVKGGAGAIPNAQHLCSLSHVFESVLSRIKKGEFSPTNRNLDDFLKAADLCRALIDNLGLKQEASADFLKSVHDVQERLEVLLKLDEASLKAQDNSNAAAGGEVPGAVSGASGNTGKSGVAAAAESNEADGVFVTSEKLDSFMKFSGEMIVLKNSFQTILRSGMTMDPARMERRLSDFFHTLNKITDGLQEQIMSVRKVTLDRSLSKLPRLVRQVSQETGKKVQFKSEGFDLGVDKTIAKALSASLVHMVRNSIDHGIEAPSVRVERGKPADGYLHIRAFENQGVIVIVIEDDGGGISKSRVLKKALEKNLISETEASRLDDSEVFELIFLPGFSTAEQVSSVSGRGVGMDVVRSAILALNGRIQIESKEGAGTKFTLSIPVPKTVIVEQTVLARSKETYLAVPLPAISRIVPASEISRLLVGGRTSFQFDGRTLRLINYHDLVPSAPGAPVPQKSIAPTEPTEGGSVIVMREKGNYVGLAVDTIDDQLEAVVRPFDGIVQAIPGFRGTTILGEDRIAYVVSPPDLVARALDLDQEAS